MREHVVTMEGTEDSIIGLSNDLVERLMSKFKAKLEGLIQVQVKMYVIAVVNFDLS